MAVREGLIRLGWKCWKSEMRREDASPTFVELHRNPFDNSLTLGPTSC